MSATKKLAKSALFSKVAAFFWRPSIGAGRPFGSAQLGASSASFDVGEQPAMRNTLHTNVRRTLVIVTLLLSLNSRLGRAGEIWDGGGSNDNIDTAANWNGDLLPPLTGGTANLVFAGTTRLTPFTNIRINPLTIEFAHNAGAFSVQGIGGIVTGTSNANGNIYNSSPIAQTFAAPVAVNRGVFYAIDGDLVFNGAVNVGNGSNASGRSLSINGDHDVYFNGLVDGTGTSAKSGGVISEARVRHLVHQFEQPIVGGAHRHRRGGPADFVPD